MGLSANKVAVSLTYAKYVDWAGGLTNQPNSEVSVYTYHLDNSLLIANPKNNTCPLAEYMITRVQTSNGTDIKSSIWSSMISVDATSGLLTIADYSGADLSLFSQAKVMFRVKTKNIIMNETQLIELTFDLDACNYNNLTGLASNKVNVSLVYSRQIAWDESFTNQPDSEISPYTFSIHNSSLITNPKPTQCPLTEFKITQI